MGHRQVLTVLLFIYHGVHIAAAFKAPVVATRTIIQTQVGRTALLPCQPKLNHAVDWGFRRSLTEKESNVCYNGRIVNGFSIRFSLNNNNLRLRDVQLSDSGIYTCVEDGGLGDQHVVQLNVADDVTLLVAVLAGEPVVLSCNTSLDAPVDWRFVRSGREANIDNICVGGRVSDQYAADYTLGTANEGHNNLHIHNVFPGETTGLYICSEDSGVGIEHKYNVTIRDDWLHVFPGDSASVNVGSSAILRCPVNSSFIRWIYQKPDLRTQLVVYNGAKLNSELIGRFYAFYSNRTHENYLIIRNVSENDNGRYVCSRLGTSVRDTFDINVLAYRSPSLPWTTTSTTGFRYAASSTAEVVRDSMMIAVFGVGVGLVIIIVLLLILIVLIIVAIVRFRRPNKRHNPTRRHNKTVQVIRTLDDERYDDQDVYHYMECEPLSEASHAGHVVQQHDFVELLPIMAGDIPSDQSCEDIRIDDTLYRSTNTLASAQFHNIRDNDSDYDAQSDNDIHSVASICVQVHESNQDQSMYADEAPSGAADVINTMPTAVVSAPDDTNNCDMGAAFTALSVC